MPKKVILVSNDDSASRLLREAIAGDQLFEFQTASSYEKALLLILEKKCCAIVADNDLYDSKTTVTFLQRVKSLWPDITRILLVGQNNINSIDKIVNSAEVYRVIYKNWDIKRAVKTLRESINQFNPKKQLEHLSMIVDIQNSRLISINRTLEKKILSKSEEIIEINHKLSSSLLATVQALSKAVEAKDELTKGHSERVAQFCVYISEMFNLSDADIEGIKMAALLHDVGKIGISEQILLKPDRLSVSEISVIRQHPVIGYKIVKPIPFGWNVAEAILQHHEFFNGCGYPYGIQGDSICLGARILNIADAFDAMTCDRPYRKALTSYEAIDQIKINSGIQFDPEIVDAFLRLFSNSKFF